MSEPCLLFKLLWFQYFIASARSDTVHAVQGFLVGSRRRGSCSSIQVVLAEEAASAEQVSGILC